MSFDHQQSARLGQRTLVESPGVWVAPTALDMPEAPHQGQLAFRVDLALIQVYVDGAWVSADGVP